MGNVIKAVWLFTREGMQDTLNLEFKVEAEMLLKKITA
jgi:hypothetical protein